MLVQFCWVRFYLGVETVSCCLLQGIARTDMDWNFKKLCQLFQVLMLCLQKSSKKYWLVFLDEIFLISIFFTTVKLQSCLWGKPLGNDFSTELTHKNTLLVTSPLQEVFVVLSIVFCKKNLRTHKFFSREPCSLYNDQQQYCTVSLKCFVLFKCFQANDSYLQMAIGNAPWPIGVTMVGIHARTGREKIFSQNVARILFL